MYSVVVLTLNEEQNLPGCLESLSNCHDIVVLDSGSKDKTHEIAQRYGARVFVNRFENFAQQRNHAHTTIPFKYDWVFHLDADEKMTPLLNAECERVLSENPSLNGYWVAPKMIFSGRWIPHCTDYPAWQARFTHVRSFRFIEVGHGQREHPSMQMGHLRENYTHDLSAHGEEGWKEKHRRYARAEAHHVTNTDGSITQLCRRLVSPENLARRRALKQLSYRLPFRPLLRFCYQYIIRRGFLDGKQGLNYCLLLAEYERWTDLEIISLRKQGARSS
ncbi:MAG TPA: glycosyltransferase family 2 protein [Opitutaceae bacterium]|nr:glycosyltransferase family 2 protein [Opitutaceae bacterium]